MKFRFLFSIYIIFLSIGAYAEFEKNEYQIPLIPIKIMIGKDGNMDVVKTDSVVTPYGTFSFEESSEVKNEDETPKIDFYKNLTKEIVNEKFINVTTGERRISETITFDRQVNLQNSVGVSGGGISFIAHIEAMASKAYSYSFGQTRIQTNEITLYASECKRYRVTTIYWIRKGTVNLNGEKIPFKIIADADIEATADSSCR